MMGCGASSSPRKTNSSVVNGSSYHINNYISIPGRDIIQIGSGAHLASHPMGAYYPSLKRLESLVIAQFHPIPRFRIHGDIPPPPPINTFMA
jgi:hypothetical protein